MACLKPTAKTLFNLAFDPIALNCFGNQTFCNRYANSGISQAIRAGMDQEPMPDQRLLFQKEREPLLTSDPGSLGKSVSLSFLRRQDGHDPLRDVQQ
jgi:hypothetical protein